VLHFVSNMASVWSFCCVFVLLVRICNGKFITSKRVPSCFEWFFEEQKVMWREQIYCSVQALVTSLLQVLRFSGSNRFALLQRCHLIILGSAGAFEIKSLHWYRIYVSSSSSIKPFEVKDFAPQKGLWSQWTLWRLRFVNHSIGEAAGKVLGALVHFRP